MSQSGTAVISRGLSVTPDKTGHRLGRACLCSAAAHAPIMDGLPSFFFPTNLKAFQHGGLGLGLEAGGLVCSYLHPEGNLVCCGLLNLGATKDSKPGGFRLVCLHRIAEPGKERTISAIIRLMPVHGVGDQKRTRPVVVGAHF